MQVVIQAAISLDGYIATEDGDSDWVKDEALFEKTCRNYGCIVLGHTTFTQYEGELFPMKGTTHIVLSKQPHESRYDNVTYAKSAKAALELAKKQGRKKLLVIGGGQTNGSFMQAGVVNELLLDVHPILLGQGKKLFGDYDGEVSLSLKNKKEYPKFVNLSYKVNSFVVH